MCCKINWTAINLDEAVLRQKEETEMMLKVTIVYPHCLNEKVDICENDKNV